jgi:OFA family oxalate/formate antiporter-like MFS transporter
MDQRKAPARAWVVTFAGTAVNLCLGILYAWSVWKRELRPPEGPKPGEPMTGLNEGWAYLNDSEATWAYSIAGLVFALFMIPGGRIQDRYGPRLGATLGGLFLAGGCILAGVMKSYLGLVLGFGLLGGIGMGMGYAAATPAAVRWFGPHQRGLIVGLVVAGYGGAAIYISPLSKYLIDAYGLSGSFIGLGVLFAAVVVVAGLLLSRPPADYTPPPPPQGFAATSAIAGIDWKAGEMLLTWQFYTLVLLFLCAAQSGLVVIGNAAAILDRTAKGYPSWTLVAFGGIVNAIGRIGTGFYSDKLGRANAYLLNGVMSVLCLLAIPFIVHSGSVGLLFLAVGVIYWQYGGSLSLLPAFTADYFGSKNLGFNYGLVFLGWGIAFFVPQVAGYIKDLTHNDDYALYLSAALLSVGVIASRFMRPPDQRQIQARG